MDEKKAFPLRMSTAVLDAVQQWANDELRSLNAQIEYVLRDALRKAGRLPKKELEVGDSGSLAKRGRPKGTGQIKLT